MFCFDLNSNVRWITWSRSAIILKGPISRLATSCRLMHICKVFPLWSLEMGHFDRWLRILQLSPISVQDQQYMPCTLYSRFPVECIWVFGVREWICFKAQSMLCFGILGGTSWIGKGYPPFRMPENLFGQSCCLPSKQIWFKSGSLRSWHSLIPNIIPYNTYSIMGMYVYIYM